MRTIPVVINKLFLLTKELGKTLELTEIFLNKVLYELSRSVSSRSRSATRACRSAACFCKYHCALLPTGYSLTTKVEHSQQKLHGLQSLKYLVFDPLHKNFVDSQSRYLLGTNGPKYRAFGEQSPMVIQNQTK